MLGVPVPVVPGAVAGGVPSMAAFRSANGIRRFFETCSVAINWPWFLNPVEAWFSVMSVGNRPWSLADNCGFDEIFWAIGLSGVVVVEPALLAVVDLVGLVPGVAAPLEEVVEVVGVMDVPDEPVVVDVAGLEDVGVVACGLP